MTLPQEDSGLFEKIDFLDLDRDEAEKLVAKYNEEGEAYKKKMDEKYGSQKSSKRDSRYIGKQFFGLKQLISGVTIEIIIRNILRHHQWSIQMEQHQELMAAALTTNKTQLPGKNTTRNIMNIMANILKVIYLSSINPCHMVIRS